jgi:hypothetical protein
MVYWVVALRQARQQQTARSRVSSLVARLGPFDSVRTAHRVRATTALLYRERPNVTIKVVCDYV